MACRPLSTIGKTTQLVGGIASIARGPSPCTPIVVPHPGAGRSSEQCAHSHAVGLDQASGMREMLGIHGICSAVSVNNIT